MLFYLHVKILVPHPYKNTKFAVYNIYIYYLIFFLINNFGHFFSKKPVHNNKLYKYYHIGVGLYQNIDNFFT